MERTDQQQPQPSPHPEALVSLAAGYLRGHARHGNHDAWLTHGSTLARHFNLTGDTWEQRQQMPALAQQIIDTHEAPITRLTQAAAKSGMPLLVAVLHVALPSTRTAPEPRIIRSVPARGRLRGYDRYAISLGAPLPNGSTIAAVEDPRGSAWLVTDTRGGTHWLNKRGDLVRYSSGVVAFIEPKWDGR